MVVSAVVKILQFDIDSGDGRVRDIASSASNLGRVRDITAGATGSSLSPRHLAPVSNPVPRSPAGGWPTESKEDWSDSPTNQPNLLYRHRFGWGRDKLEIFPQEDVGGSPLSLGDEGARWGDLGNVHGVLIHEEVYPLSASGFIRQFTVEDGGSVRDQDSSMSRKLLHMRHIPGTSGDVTLEIFPFLIIAVPEPYSTKNPITSNVFIRLANFTLPTASGTIDLYLDDVIQQDLQIAEFFGGLGGFDITWLNVSIFNYDAQVDVRWEYFDTDVPPNKFVIEYPFFTVLDLASPRVSNLVPPDQAIDVPVGGPIQFNLEDFENDVDISSLVLYVNNILVVNGENGTLQTTRLSNEKGYVVSFTPDEPWLYGDLIPVAFFVKDTSPSKNETFFTYSFTTVESLAPRLINETPEPCLVDIPVGTHVSVDVIDGGHGLNKNSIVFTVEEIERGGEILIIPIVHRDN